MTLADDLNLTLARHNHEISRLLSKEGWLAYYPREGILGQSAEAKNARINATVGQAFQDDGSPLVLPTLLRKTVLDSKETFLYSPSHGQPVLRGKWKEVLLQKNPSLKEPFSLPVVTQALTHGIYLAGKLFVNSDEEIILPDQFWGNYKLALKHARLKTFPTFDGQGFNISGLEEMLKGFDVKKVLVLNFPNNPTGYTLTEQETSDLVDVLYSAAERCNHLAVVLDDAYLGLVYEEGILQESLFSRLADLHENILAIKVDGMTKEYYAWGLRVGFLTYGTKGLAAESAYVLEEKTAGLVRETVSNICTHSQFLSLDALSSPEIHKEKEEAFAVMKGRYDTLKETLKMHPEYNTFFEPFPFNSGYFMCVDLKHHNGEEVRKQLLQKHGIGLIAMKNTLRIAYSAIAQENIPEVFDALYVTCKNLSMQ